MLHNLDLTYNQLPFVLAANIFFFGGQFDLYL